LGRFISDIDSSRGIALRRIGHTECKNEFHKGCLIQV
jgi:hypothetical protein